MKDCMRQLFRWRFSRRTMVAFAAGFGIIGLSAAMRPLSTRCDWVCIAIRDIGQIFLVGVFFPLAYIRRSGKGWAGYGFTFRKWPLFLAIDLVLGVLLLCLFLFENPPPADFLLGGSTMWSASYVMLALCFELVFFYAFLRTLFEEAFGIVPAIILTALFYAFHHIGFQPEYGKLFFVGLLYAAVYRIGNSFLLIFPLFLGVGGLYDVLIQSEVVSPVVHPEVRATYLAVVLCMTIGLFYRKGASR